MGEVFVENVVVGYFFFQAEDGIRDAQESRGLGDVYKRQPRWQVKCRSFPWLAKQWKLPEVDLVVPGLAPE